MPLYDRDTSWPSIKYADLHFKACPFCQSNIPEWNVEIIVVSPRIRTYTFQCHQCEGTFEVKASSDNAFNTGSFSKITLGNTGRGQYNYKKRGTEVTLAELKEMCGDDTPYEGISEPAPTPAPAPEPAPVTRSRSTSSSSSRSSSSSGLEGFMAGSALAPSEPEREAITRRPSSTPSSSSTTRRSTTSSTTSRPSTSSTSYRTRKPNRPFGFIGLFAGLASIVLFVVTCSYVSKRSSSSTSFAIYGLILGVLGIIFASIGLKKSRNKASSIIGLIFSILGVGLAALIYYIYISVASTGI